MSSYPAFKEEYYVHNISGSVKLLGITDTMAQQSMSFRRQFWVIQRKTCGVPLLTSALYLQLGTSVDNGWSLQNRKPVLHSAEPCFSSH